MVDYDEKNGDPWESCLTFMQDRCPNKEQAELILLLQEKPNGRDFDEVNPLEMEKAKAYCRNCKDYEKYILQ